LLPQSAWYSARWYMTLYFQIVQNCPDRDVGHNGQWMGTFVQGAFFVHFTAIP
jgi:hypothetical protein